MKKLKLTKQEAAIENALVNGKYFKIDSGDFKHIAGAIAARKKDAVLNIRVNSIDLKHIKQKAAHLGIKYQSFVSEILHYVAQG